MDAGASDGDTTFVEPIARPIVPPPPPPPPLPPPDELPAWRRRQVLLLGLGIVLLATGIVIGLCCAPEAPSELRVHLAACQAALQEMTRGKQVLEQRLRDGGGAVANRGHLRAADRLRHEQYGRRYVATLRGVQAQGASELMAWFIGRWNELLDSPQPDDRIGRRAAALSLLIGGMAANVNPGDYVPWQAEFLGNKWLSELHFDSDRDGLPSSRSGKNSHDGFANVSACQIAMALNQAVVDAQVLMMPEMRCDRPEARMSVFLQGATFDDALNEFVRAVKEHGLVVVERQDRGLRLILVGMPPPPRAD